MTSYSFTYKAGIYDRQRLIGRSRSRRSGRSVCILDPDFAPGASASSSLPVSCSAGAGDQCTIVAGKVASLWCRGAARSRRRESGTAATTRRRMSRGRSRSPKADQTITFPAIGARVYLDPDFAPECVLRTRSAGEFTRRARVTECTIVAGKGAHHWCGELHGHGVAVRERQLQRGAGCLADVHDCQG